MTKEEALKLALEFIDNLHKPNWGSQERQQVITAIKETLAQPEPEYVAFMDVPQRTWVGLTPQERDEINEQVYGAVPHHVAFHHAIEAKLKEKNT